MKLLRATLEDTQTLLGIENTTRGLKTYSGYFQKREVEDWISNDVVYIIKNNESIVGSISYEIKSNDHAYISGLVIIPEFQKQGLAKQAMLKLFEELKDFKILDLVVHPNNIGAVNLYKSLGFVPGAIKDDYFGDGEPRLIMVK